MQNNVDKEKIEQAVKMILEAIGEDPNREGLKDTPSRVARMYEEITAGYNQDPKDYLCRTFNFDGEDVVLQKDIDFASTCEHHLMPFFGHVLIAYIPDGKIVGLSKLGRLVDCFAKRLQMQERLTQQIADAVFSELNAKGVLVIIEGEHTCMTARGIKKVGTITKTMATRGYMTNEMISHILEIAK